MTRRAPRRLSPPTQAERATAAAAANALRAAIADPRTMGERQVMHVDLARPRRGEWHVTWANLPGFVRVGGRFRHASLPGWEYARHEVRAELIPDLESLAQHGLRPTTSTEATGVRDPDLFDALVIAAHATRFDALIGDATPSSPAEQPVNPTCCAKCASRPGSPERADPYAWGFLQEAWAEGVPFYCHESVPGHRQEVADDRPRWRLCAAWAATQGETAP